ncbi:MAG: ABC transporter ATP-binding protein [Lachnospiraceae bacterium]|nr:ABC transporter ATP-binding protein [Lachnospiraceae bacterium]
MYVELKDINKKYGSFYASKDVNLSIEKGKLVAFLGPSGSGKTTILRMIAGLENPTSGSIYIDGQRVDHLAPSKRGIGFMFQSYALFRYMTVYDNIAFGLRVKKVPEDQIRTRVEELIRLTNLEGVEHRYPNQISGGQRQRVAFARAIAPNPSLLLLDEPFASVDAKVRQELRSWLREMIYRLGITSIFVTHDQDEAVEVADQIVVVNRGRVEQIGTPSDIYGGPKTQFVAEFVGQSLPIHDFYRLRGYEGQKNRYSGAIVRPEFVEVFRPDNPTFKDLVPVADEAVIEKISFRGDHLELLVDVKGIKLTVSRALERRPVSVGDSMLAVVYRLYAFDRDSIVLLNNTNLQDYEAIA